MKARILGISFFFLPAVLVAQGLEVPQDWSARLDAPQRAVTGQEVAAGEWRYVAMPPGWHVTTTEQGVVLLPRNRSVSGRWAIEAELFLFPNPGEASFGILLEPATSGSNAGQLRFLMRRDGQAGVLSVSGARDSLLVPWRADTAVRAHPGAGVIRYTLRVSHEPGSLTFAINGREVAALPAGEPGRQLVPGLRVGPGLNLHVSRFDLVTPLAPARPARQ